MSSAGRTMPLAAGATDDGPPALSRTQKKNLFYASIGTMLEFYEFTLFGFFGVVVGQLFFPAETPTWLRELQTFAIFAIGYLVRPLSGIVIGHFGDKFGRKKLFMFTIFMMAAPTTVMGLLPTYAQIGLAAPLLLLVVRICQGLAVAGEIAGAAVFVSEHVPARRIGWSASWLYAAAYFAQFLGAAVAASTVAALATDTLSSIGWRVPFLVGGVCGFLAVWLRRNLDETPLFEAIKRTKQRAAAFPVGEVLRHYRAPVLFVIGLAGYQSVVATAEHFYLPAYLQNQLGLGRSAVFNATAVGLLVHAATCPVWGWIADHIGLGRVLAIGAIGNCVALTIVVGSADSIAAEPGILPFCFVLLGLFSSAVIAVPALAALVFPPEVRFTGYAMGYNVGQAIFAGTTPLMISALVSAIGRPAIVLYVAAACVLGVALAVVCRRLQFHGADASLRAAAEVRA